MGSCCITQRAQPSVCDNLRGVGCGREVQDGGDICVVLVRQKPTPHCKAIIIQLKINFKNCKKKKRKRAVITHNDQSSADQSFLNHWMM